jgi:DNA processing protein
MIKSGTQHTARHAANQGKPLFAVPGPVTSPLSAAPNYLIKNGALIATEVQDILDEIG